MKYYILAIVFLALSFVARDVEETLAHHYDRSIFAPLGHESYWFSDWERKYDEDGNRHGVIFQIMPAFYDGWHGMKLLDLFLLFNAFWFVMLSYHREKYTKRLELWYDYAMLLGIYSVAYFLLHLLFYSNLLLIK